jgi:hypothetical protein
MNIVLRHLAVALAAVLVTSGPAAAQTQHKTVGATQQPQIVPSMIVLNARSAKLAGQKLTLEGVSSNAIVFADRPVRAAGHALTAHLLEEWSNSAPDSFAKDPPNATVSALNKAAATVVDVVLVLKAPKLEGDRLTFDVQVLEGDLANADGPATVFIDIINLPMAKRTSRRAAWYAGAQ